LEAALQSAHEHRCRSGVANWEHIVELYDALHALTGSPVVLINRALAVAECDGARAGLEALPELRADERLNEYQPYWATRAELLARIGAWDEAREAMQIAIGLERDAAVRAFLEMRRARWPQ
jgi:RNA polymerase sigma-70 factor (ECF subfamily)